MKNIKKFIVLILAFAVCAAMLASCGGKKDDAVARFGGDSYIYAEDSDFSDIYNLITYYHKLESAGDEISAVEYNIILRDAVKFTVEMRLLEDEAARRGYSVDMGKVEAAANEDEAFFEATYPGGFAAFCADWKLSEDVFVISNKYYALRETAKQNFFTTPDVTEEEAFAYYEENKEDFIKKPHFEIKELFLHVADGTSREAVCNDANVYIAMLNAGKTWESVLDTAEMKYNLGNGMYFSHYLTGTEIIEKNEIENVESISLLKSRIDQEFKNKYGVNYREMFPNGFEEYIKTNGITKDSATYKRVFEAHINYCRELYNAEVSYAVTQKWETGKCYEFPVYHGGFESYVVIYFSSSEDEEGELSFEEAKADITAQIDNERKEIKFEDFISEKMDEAKVQIKYGN